MRDHDPRVERRSGRRLKLGSAALIVLADDTQIAAHCCELGPGGMTLRSTYVPGESEVVRVEVAAPPGGLQRPALVVRLEVRRCHRVAPDVFEIGGTIVEVIA